MSTRVSTPTGTYAGGTAANGCREFKGIRYATAGRFEAPVTVLVPVALVTSYPAMALLGRVDTLDEIERHLAVLRERGTVAILPLGDGPSREIRGLDAQTRTGCQRAVDLIRRGVVVQSVLEDPEP